MLELISLAKVKSLMGIEGNDHDTKLTEFIPIVSADVRRILNDPMDIVYKGYTELYDNVLKTRTKLDLGRVVYSKELPLDTYVVDYVDGGYELSSSATENGTTFVPTINISQWQAIARMVFYRASKAEPKVTGEKVQSKSIGPVSISYSLDVNRKWNYPQELLDDLGYPRLKVPC